MNSIISFIIVLGVLIFVHELGHFIFAKLFGVRVLKFSLGFGNKIVSRKWGETEYMISAFPLGGYVKMYGEQRGEDEVEIDQQHRSFSHKSVWQRFCIVAGGPVFNLVFAVVLFWMMFMAAGLPELMDTTEIGQVSIGSVAERAGFKSGDIILFIDDNETRSWEQVSELIKLSKGEEIEVTLLRGQERMKFRVVPERSKVKNLFGEVVGERYMLGITRADKVVYNRVGAVEAIEAALTHSWNMIYLTFMGVVKIIERVVPASELGGPIRIAEIAGQQLKAGWLNLISFMGLLSINLGILNLLPIPILDGGHLLFLTIEGIIRRPVNERIMFVSQRVGITILVSLMIYVFYNDILRIVTHWTDLP